MSLLPTAARLFERLPRFARRHRLMRAWMAATGEDRVQLVRIRDQHFGYADLADGFLRLVVIDPPFEPEFFALADALLAAGGVFVDGGANHGLLSFGLAGRHRDRIEFHLFEPNPRLTAAIERSLRLYPGMRCRVNRAALGEREGTVRFFFDAEQSGASHASASGTERVSCVALDDYLQSSGISRVALLKLDVEGYELKALRGASRALREKTIEAIYFEYFEKCLSRVQPPRELIDYLDEIGYETCFCRAGDIGARGGPKATVVRGRPGHGIPLLPVRGHRLPLMTDLLAVPRSHLDSIAPPAASF